MMARSRGWPVLAIGIAAVVSSPVFAQSPLEWSEQEIQELVAPVRAGRELTPESWPEGKRLAVCLSFDVEKWRKVSR